MDVDEFYTKETKWKTKGREKKSTGRLTCKQWRKGFLLLKEKNGFRSNMGQAT